jgi:CDP-diacylglycerol--glycerol-3-phosphate 3-phosphatidyltransferase
MSAASLSQEVRQRHRAVLSSSAILLAHLAMLYSGYRILEWYTGGGFAQRWFVVALITWLYEGWCVPGALQVERHHDNNLFCQGLGVGNHLTLCRGLLICGLSGFLCADRLSGVLGWIPGVMYLLAIVIDHFDGYLARLHRRTSRFGQRLDRDLDALGVLLGSLLAVGYGQAPVWFVLTGIAYYAFQAGIWLRTKRYAPVGALPSSRTRRIIAGCQMGGITVLLLPLLSLPVTTLVAGVFSVPFLTRFVWDWLIVTGRIGGTDPAGTSLRVPHGLCHWVPLVWRAGACLAVGGVLIRGGTSSAAPNGAAMGIDWVSGGSRALMGLAGAAGLVLAIGALGRVASLVLLVVAVLLASINELDWRYGTIVAMSTLGLMFGTGGLSLWRADEPWFLEHAGGGNDEIEREKMD